MGIKDIEILERRQNPLLNREEINFRIVYEGATPKRNEVRDSLIANLKLKPELTILDSIKPRFGSNAATGYVKSYTNKESMSVEHSHKLKKNFPEVKKKEKGEAEKEAAEEKKEAAEEKKEAAEEKKEAAEEKKEAAEEAGKEAAEKKPEQKKEVEKEAAQESENKGAKTEKEVVKDE